MGAIEALSGAFWAVIASVSIVLVGISIFLCVHLHNKRVDAEYALESPQKVSVRTLKSRRKVLEKDLAVAVRPRDIQVITQQIEEIDRKLQALELGNRYV